jgi:hypothetical protein
MVAYSFQKQFILPILAGDKRQTIRAHRRRHARPGERLSLFTGMRTKHCNRIIPDPICTGVASVVIDLRPLNEAVQPTTAHELEALALQVTLIVEGQSLAGAAREMFARADGFACHVWKPDGTPLTAWAAMVDFWMATYRADLFEGVVIHWVATQ